MNKISTQDRSRLIRLASQMPVGSQGRRAILSGLRSAGKPLEEQEFKHPETGNKVRFKSLPKEEQAKIRKKMKGGGKPENSAPKATKEQAGKMFKKFISAMGSYRPGTGKPENKAEEDAMLSILSSLPKDAADAFQKGRVFEGGDREDTFRRGVVKSFKALSSKLDEAKKQAKALDKEMNDEYDRIKKEDGKKAADDFWDGKQKEFEGEFGITLPGGDPSDWVEDARKALDAAYFSVLMVEPGGDVADESGMGPEQHRLNVAKRYDPDGLYKEMSENQ